MLLGIFPVIICLWRRLSGISSDSVKPLYTEYRPDAVSGIKGKQSWDYIVWIATFYSCHYLKSHDGFNDSCLTPCIQNISSSHVTAFILWNNGFEEDNLTIGFTNNWHFGLITFRIFTFLSNFVSINFNISVQPKAMLSLAVTSSLTHQFWLNWWVFE